MFRQVWYLMYTIGISFSAASSRKKRIWSEATKPFCPHKGQASVILDLVNHFPKASNCCAVIFMVISFDPFVGNRRLKVLYKKSLAMEGGATAKMAGPVSF